MTSNFFHPSLLLLFWIRDPGWVKIRIRDKHSGSATLPNSSLPFLHPEFPSFQDIFMNAAGGRGRIVYINPNSSSLPFLTQGKFQDIFMNAAGGEEGLFT